MDGRGYPQLRLEPESRCAAAFLLVHPFGLEPVVGASAAISGAVAAAMRFAFQRGQFSAHNTLLVTMLQQAYLWQLPGAMVGMVAVRYVAAQGRYRAMTIGTVAMVPITGFLQWTLSEVWGAAGLAFGMSAGAALTAIVFFWLALRPGTKPMRSWKTA